MVILCHESKEPSEEPVLCSRPRWVLAYSNGHKLILVKSHKPKLVISHKSGFVTLPACLQCASWLKGALATWLLSNVKLFHILSVLEILPRMLCGCFSLSNHIYKIKQQISIQTCNSLFSFRFIHKYFQLLSIHDSEALALRFPFIDVSFL